MEGISMLTPLKFRDYVWPHNPRTYVMNYEKRIVTHSYPYTNYNEIDDLGVKPREVTGEGEFVGEGAYNEFKKLANVFYEKGPGKLIHPNWQIQNAVFISLKVEEEPTPNYVKYSFSFIEDIYVESIIVKELKTNEVISNISENTNKAKETKSKGNYHTVKKGENLSLIAKKNKQNLKELIKKNPQIKNPNLIYPGQKIKL